MKNLIKYGFIALVICFFTACGETHVHEVVNRTKTIEIQTEVIVKKVSGNDSFKVVEIDGCEYIVYSVINRMTDGFGNGSVGGICHKANCKNPNCR